MEEDTRHSLVGYPLVAGQNVVVRRRGRGRGVGGADGGGRGRGGGGHSPWSRW